MENNSEQQSKEQISYQGQISLDDPQAFIANNIDQQSEEYQQLLAQTHVYRARVRSKLSEFLLDSPVGNFLVKNGFFRHPVEKEIDIYETKVTRLARQLHYLGVTSTLQEAEILAVKSWPDLEPHSKDYIFLENAAQQAVLWRESATDPYSSNQYLKEVLDIREDTEKDIGEIKDLTQARVYQVILPEVISNTRLTYVRDHFLGLIERENWQGVVDMIVFNPPKTIDAFSQLFDQYHQYLFQLPGFRRFITNYMIRILITQGVDSFNTSNRLFVKYGLQIEETAEKQKYLDQDSLWKMLESQWDKNAGLAHFDQLKGQVYFDKLILLYQYGLLPENFHLEPRLLVKLFELVLFSLQRGERRPYFAKVLRPFAISTGIINTVNLRIENRHVLYAQYRQLCQSTGHQESEEIRKNYGTSPKASRWEE